MCVCVYYIVPNKKEMQSEWLLQKLQQSLTQTETKKREVITYLSLTYKKCSKYRYNPTPNHIINIIVDDVTQAMKNLSIVLYL